LSHRDLRVSGEGGGSEYFLTQERAAVDSVLTIAGGFGTIEEAARFPARKYMTPKRTSFLKIFFSS
jgi:hypothetical protein